jgi:hypothetical protein
MSDVAWSRAVSIDDTPGPAWPALQDSQLQITTVADIGKPLTAPLASPIQHVAASPEPWSLATTTRPTTKRLFL